MTSQIIDHYVHSINLVKFKKYILTNGPPLDLSRGGQCPPLNLPRGGQCPPLDFPRGGQCPPLNFSRGGKIFSRGGGQCPPLGGAVYHPVLDAVWLLADDDDKFGILPVWLLIVVMGVFWLVVIPVGPTGSSLVAIAILLPGRCLGMFSKLPLVTGTMFSPGWLM